MDRLKDLVTILYKPRETMRRILDRPDRWSVSIVFLAFVAASVNDIEGQRANEVLQLGTVPLLALSVVGIVAGALLWVIALFLLSWIATGIGRVMQGTGSARDVRAALGWAMVPIIWSAFYRLPLLVLARRAHLGPNINAKKAILEFVSHGGLSLVVLFLSLQLIFALWCVGLASFTVAEAQKFSPEKGFVNVVMAIALPIAIIIAAAVISWR
jgi:hypothetical protein